MPAKKKTTGTSGTRRPRAKKESPPPAAGSPFTASSFAPGMSQDCLMCPFGLFYFTMRNTRPEVMEHLTAAGHELFLAFRALVEQTGERWDQAQSLQRITVR
jgi:uncharacterized protein DUF5304